MKTIKILFVAIIIIFVKYSPGQNPVVQNIINDVCLDSMITLVKQLSGQIPVSISGNIDTILSRCKYCPDNWKAYQFVKQKYISYGLPFDTVQFSTDGVNIWVTKTGTLYPNHKYIIGAHYDNVCLANYYRAPGADDNAGGTAAVIEAARIFSNYSFPYTIIFALWDEEEQYMAGSSFWTYAAKSNNDTILGYINLDMIGYDGNNDNIAEISTKPIAKSVQLANLSIQCNTVYNIALDSIIIDNSGSNSSDHESFWSEDYTAICLREDNHNDFNPYYHTLNDSLKFFNLPFYLKVTKLALATLATLAISNNEILSVNHKENNTFCKISVYPNPSSGRLQIDVSNSQSKIYNLGIYNILGICVFSSKTEISKIIVDLSVLPKGIYFAKIYDEKENYLEKIIIE